MATQGFAPPEAQGNRDRLPETGTLDRAERARVERQAVLQRLMNIGISSAPMRANLIQQNLGLYYQETPASYRRARPEFLELAKTIRAGLADIPEEFAQLKEDIEEHILPQLTHGEIVGDDLPDNADFLEAMGKGRFCVKIRILNRKRGQVDQWLRWLDRPNMKQNPMTQRLRQTLLLTLGGLNAYAQILSPAEAGFAGITFQTAESGDPTGILKTPPGVDPKVQAVRDQAGQVVRLAGMVTLGGLGLLTGIMGLKTNDFRLPAFYLGMATLFAIGEKRLREFPNEKLLRELCDTGIGNPDSNFERLTQAYEIRGAEWGSVVTRMQDVDLGSDALPAIQKMKNGEPVSPTEANALLITLLPTNPPDAVRKKLNELIRNDNGDFLTFVGLVQKGRSDEAQECFLKYVASGTTPADLNAIAQREMQKNARASSTPPQK